MDWCLDLCYFKLLFGGGGGGGVDFCFIIFGRGGWGVGVACFGILRGQILFNFCFFLLSNYFLNFFPHFFNIFLKKNLLFFLVGGGGGGGLWWNFINICPTFTHSFTQFFCVLE